MYAQVYSDDVILVSGEYGQTITELLSNALEMVNAWCGCVGSKYIPLKTTIIVPFTIRLKIGDLGPVFRVECS